MPLYCVENSRKKAYFWELQHTSSCAAGGGGEQDAVREIRNERRRNDKRRKKSQQSAACQTALKINLHTQEGKEAAIYSNTPPLCYFCGHALTANTQPTAPWWKNNETHQLIGR